MTEFKKRISKKKKILILLYIFSSLLLYAIVSLLFSITSSKGILRIYYLSLEETYGISSGYSLIFIIILVYSMLQLSIIELIRELSKMKEEEEKEEEEKEEEKENEEEIFKFT